MDVSLTVNLGAALPTLQPDPTWAKRGWPLEYQCDFRQRLGQLLNGQDQWWHLRLKPIAPTAKYILRGLQSKGLPWLDAHGDPQQLLAGYAADQAPSLS